MDTGHAAVVGASGGIGGAVADALAERGWRVTRLARSGSGTALDLTDEGSIADAAETVTRPLDLLFVATGALRSLGRDPERSLDAIDPAALAHLFAVNATGPALVLKHFRRHLPRDRRAVAAFLSARVGSIGDNRSGGWYGYRASKAALNMIVRSAAIELRRTHPLLACVGLHPGTVDTELSRPFAGRVPADRLFDPARSAAYLLDVIEALRPADSGGCFAWDGTVIPP